GGPDPERLLRLARAEDGAALGQLLELYRGYLALLARLQIGRRLQGKVDAADLVQDTFLEAQGHEVPFGEIGVDEWFRPGGGRDGCLRRGLVGVYPAVE